MKIRFAKTTFTALALVLTFAFAVFAREGDKKTPKKPDPPVVIVYLDKKTNDKQKEEDSEKKKNNVDSLVFSLIKSFD